MDPWFDRLDSRLGQYLDPAVWDNDDFFIPSSRYSRVYRPRVRTAWVSASTAGPADQNASGEGNKELFSVKLDVHQFLPDEVKVKTKDNSLIIEAKHEEREDSHGFIARHFVRRYTMPDDVKVDQLCCNMSSDGILELSAPRRLVGGETVVPIRQTYRPAKMNTPTPTTNPSGAAPTSPRLVVVLHLLPLRLLGDKLFPLKGKVELQQQPRQLILHKELNTQDIKNYLPRLLTLTLNFILQYEMRLD